MSKQAFVSIFAIKNRRKRSFCGTFQNRDFGQFLSMCATSPMCALSEVNPCEINWTSIK